MSLCGQLGVYGQASSKLSKSWFQPQERSNDLLRRLNSPSSVTQLPFELFPPTPPLSFHELAIQVASQNVALANMNLVFGFRNVQLANMNMAFGHCACDFIQASTPVQQCLFNVCLLSSSIFTHGHRPAVNDQWSLGSQVILVLFLRCPGFCVFCGWFWSWNMAVYISGVVIKEIVEAHVLSLAWPD